MKKKKFKPFSDQWKEKKNEKKKIFETIFGPMEKKNEKWKKKNLNHFRTNIFYFF